MLVDLCRGPHLRHTGQIGGLKLLTVSYEDRQADTPAFTGVSGAGGVGTWSSQPLLHSDS